MIIKNVNRIKKGNNCWLEFKKVIMYYNLIIGEKII